MRTFVAVPLPAEVRSLLGEAQKKLRSFGADVRWTAVDSIHLTLKFLGEIDAAVLPRFVRPLRAVGMAHAPILLRLHGLGGFPNLRLPRVIWLGLAGDVALLESLQQAVETACIDAGFAREERPFRPHLTLGRVRGKSNLQALLDYITIGRTLEYEFVAREFNVYQSTLRPQGAIYSVLEKIELKGG